MHIAEIHLTPVAIPDRPLLNCKGVHQPHALRTIIEVICDDGTVGLGETYGSIKALDGLRRAAPSVAVGWMFLKHRGLASHSIGRNSPNLRHLTNRPR